MRIQPTGEASPMARIVERSTAQTARIGEDKVALDGANALDQALKNTPEVRASEVTRARELIQDTNYPPEVLVRKIAALFAIDLGKTDPLDQDSSTAS